MNRHTIAEVRTLKDRTTSLERDAISLRRGSFGREETEEDRDGRDNELV